jgi:alkanesulfonate monooxygenase SsuD/methylene tetrahydromethanopterin reductase-like flavin-dependent oxidoreductase (luciferase family)
MKLSALDQSPIRKGGTARDALLETIELAKACERFGYSRYWLAEHHNTTSFAGSTPEVLISRVSRRRRRRSASAPAASCCRITAR